jgi:hypothetical protein
MAYAPKLVLVCGLLLAAVVAGCGGSSHASSAGAGSTGSSASALAADARSAATGDIPDNQAFLLFTNRSAGYAIKYPEGWTQSGAARNVTFRDKNNLVRVTVAHGSLPSPAAVVAELTDLKRSQPTLSFGTPQHVKLGTTAALKVVYTTESPPNPVTGRRVKLAVDRYKLAGAGRVATVDLGTPIGVDNVDAYRLMIESFRWR